MSWLEAKYVRLLSGRLERFKYKNGAWNFRCPICGDSEKNERKTRGYIYERQGGYFFHCHNCGASKRFNTFLRDVHPTLYEEYVREAILDKAGHRSEPVFRGDDDGTNPVEGKIASSDVGLDRVIDLAPDHPARRYIDSRRIPSSVQHTISFAPKFFVWANSKVKEPITFYKDEPRIVLPMLDKEGNMFGFQGRSLDPNASLRYITIKIDKEAPNVFGLDRFDTTKPGYVFEGPIDSLMIDNSLATNGKVLHMDLERVGVKRDLITLVYDNEKRNEFTVKKIRSSIDAGWRVCIWPIWVPRKDVNDLVVKEGWSIDKVKKTIDENSSTGLRATFNLNDWKRT